MGVCGMKPPYFADDSVTLHLGDTLDVLRTMPSESVNCCVTSPPYFGLRDYGQPGQYGLEASPAEYVETMRQVFAEVRRVLTKDGTCWVNLGDSYAGSTSSGPTSSSSTLRGNGHVGGGPKQKGGAGRPSSRRDRAPVSGPRRLSSDLPAKNLLGIPWRVAFALQDDGWYLRNAITWHKTNAMPSSVEDRLSNRSELIFLLTKSRRYWFDLASIREPLSYPDAADGTRTFGGKHKGVQGGVGSKARNRGQNTYSNSDGRNPGDVWTISTTPFPGSHFAVFPPEIPRRCILAGCPEGGTVLDPFSGSATTGMVAQQLGRRYVGIDLNADYHDLALRTRLLNASLPFGGGPRGNTADEASLHAAPPAIPHRYPDESPRFSNTLSVAT